MNKKKLISIVLSALLAVLAAVCGCVFGVDVDIDRIDFNKVETDETDTVDIVALCVMHGEND